MEEYVQQTNRGFLGRALKRIPGLVACVHTFRRMRREVNAVAYGLLGRLRYLVAPAGARSRFQQQAILAQQAPSNGTLEHEPLVAALDGRGLRYAKGESAIYIPQQPQIEEVLGDIAHLYPRDATFKVLDGEGNGPRSTVLVGNLLHERGLGPRIYDAFSLEGKDTSMTVLALGDGECPAPPEERAAVLDGISGLLGSGDLTALNDDWSGAEHVRAATNGGGGAHYVGFENFKLQDPDKFARQTLDKDARNDLHFGTEYALKGRRYLYQSVPGVGAAGRRDTLRRWEVIRSMLEDAGIRLEDRLVLDFGCNAGMMLAAALADGALWGLGWDRPQVIDAGRKVLLASGYTRFDLFGSELTEDYPVEQDVPLSLRSKLPGSIVFYLAFRHNVGFFLSSLGDLPWTAMVYEGGEEESVETLEQSLEGLRSLCDFSVASAIDFRDSETDSRPLAVLIRH